MVAAKLDQSRVFVTKFRQNLSTLKGRSADQTHTHRQTDRQTNSAENNGPSDLQCAQQTGGWLENKETESVKQTNISLYVGTDPCIYH